MSAKKQKTMAFVQLGSKDAIPMSDKRAAITKNALQKLGLKAENAATYPVVGSNNSPMIPRNDVSTEQPIASVQDATWEQCDTLLNNCMTAFDKWRKVSANERVKIVLEMIEEMKKLQDPLGELETLEVGKIPTESLGEIIEVFDVGDVIQKRQEELGGESPYFTRFYDSSDEKRKALGWKGEELKLPLGIIGKMTAFNFPYAVYGWGALPALCAGNAVFLKPHPASTLTSLALIRIMADVCKKHGFDGLVSMASLSDFDLTAKLWKDDRIALWEVTGGVPMGAAYAAAVAPTFKRSILELGGNNAVVLNKDANIANAIESTLFGATGTAGQRCTTTRVAYVHEDIYEEAKKTLIEGYNNHLNIGDPLQPHVNVGPVFHQRQVDLFKDTVASHKKAGSKLLAGGNHRGGNFVEPTLFEGPHVGYEPVDEEKFVPILHLIKFKESEVDKLIFEINKTGYGLTGGVFTKDDAFFRKFLENIRVGILNQNYGSSGAEAGENFGGEGKTGNCRMLGPNMFHTYRRMINTLRAPADAAVVHAQGVDVKN